MGTTQTTRKFKIVDLIRYKNPKSMIEVPKYPVEVVIDVTTKSKIGKAKEVPSSKMDRLERAARTELERYEKIITEELKKFDAKIAETVKPGTKKAIAEAESIAKTTSTMVKNALDSAKGAAEKAVETTLKKEAKGDRLLTEARVKTGIKITTSVISLGANVAKLVGTAGADVSSYLSIAKTIYGLGKEIQQQLKGEEKLRKDLNSGVKAFLKLRESTLTQAAKRNGLTDLSGIDIKKPMDAIKSMLKKLAATKNEMTKGKSPKEIGASLIDFVVKGVKSKLKDVEKARTAYRNHITKMRQKIDKVAVEADKLMKAMKAAKTLKEGVKIGAECMQVKGRVRALDGKFVEADKHLEGMQDLLKANGMEIDDRTVIEKLKAFDKATFVSEGSDLLSSIKTVHGFISEVAKVVA
ncbi:MAG: hypothetical protein O7G85_12760 [Planctomycetota bacterium]|nr:hypothetical protein [Planctomycetota bacterium]